MMSMPVVCTIDGCRNPCMFDSLANVVIEHCRTHYEDIKYNKALERTVKDNPVMSLAQRKKELQNYNAAVMRGRHPRSCPALSALWSFADDGKNIIKRARCKQTVVHGMMELNNRGRISPTSFNNNKKKLKPPSTKARLKGLFKTIQLTKYMENREAHKHLDKEERNTRRRQKISSDLDKKLLKHLAKDSKEISAAEYAGVLSPKEREKPKPAANTWGTIRDFNTIRGTKIFYGSMVAFELVSEGTWLTVGRKCFRAKFRTRGERYVFKLVNLRNPSDVGLVNFGDDVWLCSREGSSRKDKPNSQVVGSRMRVAVNLMDDGDTKAADTKHKFMGNAVPIDAVLLKDREYAPDVVTKAVQSNRKPLAIAKWRIRRATSLQKGAGAEESSDDSPTKEEKVQIFNLCEVRVEQDWYYLAAPKGRDQEVQLRCLSKDLSDRTHAVDSSGLWRIHLVQPRRQESTKRGIQEMENILYSARRQLQRSTGLRNGNKKKENLPSGTKFARQIRLAKQEFDVRKESAFLKQRKLDRRNLLQKSVHGGEVFRFGVYHRPSTSTGFAESPGRRKRYPAAQGSQGLADLRHNIFAFDRGGGTFSMMHPFTSQVDANRRQLDFNLKGPPPLRRAIDFGTTFERHHRLLRTVRDQVETKFKKDQSPSHAKLRSLIQDKGDDERNNLQPQLDKYKQQDILIQEHLEREEEIQNAEKKKQVIDDADADDFAPDDIADPEAEHRDVTTTIHTHSL